MKLPLGCVDSEGTGKIRKIVIDSSAATETFLAHNLPDKAVSYATPVGLLAMMMIFDCIRMHLKQCQRKQLNMLEEFLL